MATVLVVDDIASVRLLIRTNLEIAGFDVEEATDGRECLERLLGDGPTPDGLIIDVMMPRLGGLDAVKLLRNNPRTRMLPIIMVTTQTQDADIKRGWRAGVDAYVSKPFDPDELVRMVKSVLGMKPDEESM